MCFNVVLIKEKGHGLQSRIKKGNDRSWFSFRGVDQICPIGIKRLELTEKNFNQLSWGKLTSSNKYLQKPFKKKKNKNLFKINEI